MILIDVYWTNIINMLTIKCDCGETFNYPSNHSLVECPSCYNREIWHRDGKDFKELENYKVMDNVFGF